MGIARTFTRALAISSGSGMLLRCASALLYFSERESSMIDPIKSDPLQSAPLAYQNETFLNSPDGRILRILAEYQEPLARFRREQIQDTVVFFGSARFEGKSAATKNLTALEKNEANAPLAQQEENLKRAHASVDMARYYEDARRLAHMLTTWSIPKPAARPSD